MCSQYAQYTGYARHTGYARRTRNTRFFALLAVGVVVFAAGCSKPDPTKVLVGHWKISPSAIALQSPKLTQAPGGGRVSNQEAYDTGKFYGSFSVDFRADHTFTLTEGAQTEGTWTLAGTTVTMTPTKFGGKTVSASAADTNFPKMTGELNPDIMYFQIQPSAPGGIRLSFDKTSE